MRRVLFAIGGVIGVIVLIAAGVIGCLAALLFGPPILRLRGPYFAIVTLGLAAVMGAIVSNLEIAGKNIGLILPLIKGDGRLRASFSVSLRQRSAYSAFRCARQNRSIMLTITFATSAVSSIGG